MSSRERDKSELLLYLIYNKINNSFSFLWYKWLSGNRIIKIIFNWYQNQKFSIFHQVVRSYRSQEIVFITLKIFAISNLTISHGENPVSQLFCFIYQIFICCMWKTLLETKDTVHNHTQKVKEPICSEYIWISGVRRKEEPQKEAVGGVLQLRQTC